MGSEMCIRDSFDSGNRLYARALAVCCPNLQASNGWTDETAGDIIESLLGFVILDDMDVALGLPPRLHESSPPRQLAVWLEQLVYAIHLVTVLQKDSEIGSDQWARDNATWLREVV